MRIPASPRITVALTVIILLLVGLCAKLAFDTGLLGIRVELARGQIEIIDATKRNALQSDLAGAADCLRYVLDYYPSGTKQIPGSRLDRIVETQRSNAVETIISHLRQKSGEDLGEDPHKWIEKFARK